MIAGEIQLWLVVGRYGFHLHNCGFTMIIKKYLSRIPMVGGEQTYVG